MIALLANCNVLLEGLPGLAKTRAIKSLSKNVHFEFSQIQFTPNLLPSDVTGGEIYRTDDKGVETFEFRQGPVFGNIVLADEVNSAPRRSSRRCWRRWRSGRSAAVYRATECPGG